MKNLSLSEKEKYFSSICTSMGLTPYDLNSQTDSQLIKLHIVQSLFFPHVKQQLEQWVKLSNKSNIWAKLIYEFTEKIKKAVIDAKLSELLSDANNEVVEYCISNIRLDTSKFNPSESERIVWILTKSLWANDTTLGLFAQKIQEYVEVAISPSKQVLEKRSSNDYFQLKDYFRKLEDKKASNKTDYKFVWDLWKTEEIFGRFSKIDRDIDKLRNSIPETSCFYHQLVDVLQRLSKYSRQFDLMATFFKTINKSSDKVFVRLLPETTEMFGRLEPDPDALNQLKHAKILTYVNLFLSLVFWLFTVSLIVSAAWAIVWTFIIFAKQIYIALVSFVKFINTPIPISSGSSISAWLLILIIVLTLILIVVLLLAIIELLSATMRRFSLPSPIKSDQSQIVTTKPQEKNHTPIPLETWIDELLTEVTINPHVRERELKLYISRIFKEYINYNITDVSSRVINEKTIDKYIGGRKDLTRIHIIEFLLIPSKFPIYIERACSEKSADIKKKSANIKKYPHIKEYISKYQNIFKEVLSEEAHSEYLNFLKKELFESVITGILFNSNQKHSERKIDEILLVLFDFLNADNSILNINDFVEYVHELVEDTRKIKGISIKVSLKFLELKGNLSKEDKTNISNNTHDYSPSTKSSLSTIKIKPVKPEYLTIAKFFNKIFESLNDSEGSAATSINDEARVKVVNLAALFYHVSKGNVPQHIYDDDGIDETKQVYGHYIEAEQKTIFSSFIQHARDLNVKNWLNESMAFKFAVLVVIALLLSMFVGNFNFVSSPPPSPSSSLPVVTLSPATSPPPKEILAPTILKDLNKLYEAKKAGNFQTTIGSLEEIVKQCKPALNGMLDKDIRSKIEQQLTSYAKFKNMNLEEVMKLKSSEIQKEVFLEIIAKFQQDNNLKTDGIITRDPPASEEDSTFANLKKKVCP